MPLDISHWSSDRYDRGFDMKIATHVIFEGNDENWFSFDTNPKTDRPLFLSCVWVVLFMALQHIKRNKKYQCVYVYCRNYCMPPHRLHATCYRLHNRRAICSFHFKCVLILSQNTFFFFLKYYFSLFNIYSFTCYLYTSTFSIFTNIATDVRAHIWNNNIDM